MGTTAATDEDPAQPSGQARWRSRLGLLGLVSLLSLIALSTYNAVTTDRFIVDLSITRWLQKLEVNESVEELLFYAFFWGMAGVILVLVWVWLWFWGHRIDAVILVLANIPNSFNFLLRDFYGRPRPSEDLVNVIGGPAGMSYPSGHAVLVLFIYGFLIYLLTRYTRSRLLIYSALALWLLYIPFGGLWISHIGRHWPSDVFGGYLYALLYLVVWIKLFHLGRAWERRHPDVLTMATLRRIGARWFRPAGVT